MKTTMFIGKKNNVEVYLLFLGIIVGVMMFCFSLIELIVGMSFLVIWISIFLAFLLASQSFRLFSKITTNMCSSQLLTILPFIPLLLFSTLIPVYAWDEVAYSVALPQEFAKTGKYFYNSFYGPYGAFPGNYEALTATSLFLFESIVAIKLLNIFLLIGTAASAGAITWRLGGCRTSSIFTMLLVMIAPIFIATAVAIKNDLANAFFQTLSVLLAVMYFQFPSRRLALMIGVMLGFALGIKYSTLQFCICIAASIVITKLAYERVSKHAMGDLFAIALAAAAVGFPWYLNNTLLFHNPVFPFFNDFFSSTLGIKNSFTYLHSEITKEMFTGIIGWNYHSGNLSDFIWKHFKGFGIGFLLLPPSLILILFKKSFSKELFFIFVLTILLTFFTYRFGYWEPRYMLVLLCLASVVVVIASKIFLDFCASQGGLSTSLPILFNKKFVVASLILIMLFVLVQQYKRLARDLKLWADSTDEMFYNAKFPYYGLAKWINQNLEDGDRVAIMNAQPFLFLNKPYFHIHPMTEKGNIQNSKNSEEVLQKLLSMGVTHIAIVRTSYQGWYIPELTPNSNTFYNMIYSTVDELSLNQKISLQKRINDVEIYHIIEFN